MEGAAAAELAENMRDNPRFRVPALDWSRTASRVLTTEWIEGAPCAIRGLAQAAMIRKQSSSRCWHVSHSSPAYGFFHADSAYRKLFVDKDGRICAVDFGIMGPRCVDAPVHGRDPGGFLARDYVRVAHGAFRRRLRAAGPTASKPLPRHCAPSASDLRPDRSAGLDGAPLGQLFETTRRSTCSFSPTRAASEDHDGGRRFARSLDPDFDIWEASAAGHRDWWSPPLAPNAASRRRPRA